MTPKDRGATGDAKLSENYRRVPGENQGENQGADQTAGGGEEAGGKEAQELV